MKEAKQRNLQYQGRNSEERADIILPDATHLRLRSGDIIALTDEQATWLLSQRPYKYWFRESDREPQRAVAGTDIQHDASVQLGGQ